MKTFRFAPIALIDSGIGGLSLLKTLVNKYPNENYIYLADNLNMPYGNKSKKWLKSRIIELINYLYDSFNVKLVILACNTASTCLEQINKNSPVKVIGLDLRGCVVDDYKILCTKLTAKNHVTLNTCSCSRLASFIEDNIFSRNATTNYVKRLLNKVHLIEKNIILGCTHYELISDIFGTLLPDKNIIFPCKNFVNNIVLDKPNISNVKGDILMLSTLSTKSYSDKLWKVFNTR